MSIHSTLIFGSQEMLLAQSGASFCGAGPSDTQIGRAFAELGMVAQAESLKDHVTRGEDMACALDYEFLGGFGNFHAVVVGQAEEFRDFNYQQFFTRLAESIQELEQKQAEVEVTKLLSAEQFLMAVRALNRRFRPLELVRNLNEAGSKLQQMTSELQVAGAQLDLVSPAVRELAAVPRYLPLSISIGMAESVLVQTVSDLLLTVSGLARLTAHGLLPQERFLKNLNSLLSPEGESVGRRTRRLSLLLSLAPELFAFHMLFWEATLKPLART